MAVGSSKGKTSTGGGAAGSARAVAGRAGTNRVSNSCILRIQQEITQLIQEPVPFIYVEPDEEDITHIQALIIGPLETPYAVRFYAQAGVGGGGLVEGGVVGGRVSREASPRAERRGVG